MNYPISLHKADALRSPENLQKYRKKARRVFREVVLNHHRDALWPLLRHTDFLNQQVGMKTTTNFFSAQDSGGSLMHAQTKNGGFNVAYEEFPYVWDAPSVYAVERIFIKGPIKYLQFKVALEEIEQQTRVTCSIEFVAILPPPLAKLIIGQEIEKFMTTFQRLADRLEKGEKGMLPFFKILPESALTLHTEKWSAFTSEPNLARDLVHYFLCAPERLSYRLRPREFSAWYDHDPLAVLNLCLYLSAQGELKMHWDCRCPGCKGPKESYSSLQQLKEVGYCESCGVHYGVAFDQNIELTFSPAEHVRKVTDAFFCAGSPGNTPHVAWQQIVPANTTQTLHLECEPGQYALRALQFQEQQALTLHAATDDTTHQNQLHFTLTSDSVLKTVTAAPLHCQKILTLTFENKSPHAVTLMLEDILWQDLSVTAAGVQCVQMFHDVFPRESLNADLELPLGYQVFLELHWHKADAELMQWSRYQLAQFQGAVLTETLSTNQVRCVFASDFEALAAAWSLQEAFDEMAEFYDEAQKLTLAIASGPCTVSTQEQSLAYTGPATEQLKAILSRAKTLTGNNILLPAAFFSQAEVATFLEQSQANYRVKTYQVKDPLACVQFQWGVLHGV